MLTAVWRRYGSGLLFALLVIVLALEQCKARQAGALSAKLDASDATVATLRDSLETARATVRTDTVRLTRTETHYRTFRDTVLARLTDTVVHVDTVRMLIARADSTIHACRITVRDCLQRAEAAERLAGELTRQNAILRHQRPGFWDRFGIYGGYGATATPGGELRHGVQVGVGVRLWP